MVNRKILFSVTVIAILTLSVAGAWAGETDAAISGSVVKWSQPPDLVYGVNIQSTEVEPIVADDWQCRDPRPVTDVHFWGSYIGWRKRTQTRRYNHPESRVL